MNILKKGLSVFEAIVWCLSLSWKASKFYTIIRIGSGMTLPLLIIVASFIGRDVINILAGINPDGGNRIHLIYLLVGQCVIALVRAAIQKAMQYCETMHNDLLDSRIALDLMERALSADLAYFDNPTYHDKLMSINRDSYAITHILWNAMTCVSTVISFVGAFLVLCQANFIYGIIMLVAAIPSSIAASRYTKSLYRLSLEQMNGQRRMDYYQRLAVNKSYAQDLRLFNAGNMLKSRYKHIWNELFTSRRSMMRKRAVLTGLLEYLPEITAAYIGIDIALRVMVKSATVGDYSLYTGLVAQLWAAISSFSFAIMGIYDNQMKIDNYKTIESFQNSITENGQNKLEYVETIEFEHVTFTYPDAKGCVMDDVSFMLHKEKKVALVGLNGSGKSTLIKLLLRMYDPDIGIIRINNIDIKEYTLTSLRKNFSVYFQDMDNYSFTLRENFTIAGVDHKNVDSAIGDAMAASNCEDIFSKASKSLDTNVTRLFDIGGIELSGGQHQKLALARALYRPHTALVLDEPSSNLDPKAEHDVFENLKRITDGKMVIFTSHRLSNVFLADRIIVLEKGRIVEDGTQSELLKNKQRYAELFRYQQEKYTANAENH